MQREPRDVAIRLPSRPHPARETNPTAHHAAMRANRPGCGPCHVDDGKTPQMAPNDDSIFSTGIAPDLPTETAAPVKKAVAKRAPRKATKKASAPQSTPDGATEAGADGDAAITDLVVA